MQPSLPLFPLVLPPSSSRLTPTSPGPTSSPPSPPTSSRPSSPTSLNMMMMNYKARMQTICQKPLQMIGQAL